MHIRSRIAPTPSGYLHVGNAFNFLLTWLITKKGNGTLRLRIDDLDAPRAQPEYVEDIFKSLEWLGLSWDEGPQSAEEQYSKFSQQNRIEQYRAVAKQLKNKAACFYCSCSRTSKEDCTCDTKNLQWKLNETALKIKTGTTTIRFQDVFTKTEMEVNLDTEMKDFVVWRKDGLPSYQLASLVDDLEYGTNLIVRGQDLLSSTAAQLFLAQQLGHSEFGQVRFYHHPLRVDEQGKKLSKSAGSTSLKSMREQGIAASEVYRQFAAWMGWNNVPDGLEGLLNESLKFHV